MSLDAVLVGNVLGRLDLFCRVGKIVAHLFVLLGRNLS